MMKSTASYQHFLYKLDAPLDNKFALISLLCYITHQMRSKHKDWKVKDTFKKIRADKMTANSPDFIDNLCEMCEDIMFGQDKFPTFNLKGYKDMFKIINEVLDRELPFRSDEKAKCPF